MPVHLNAKLHCTTAIREAKSMRCLVGYKWEAAGLILAEQRRLCLFYCPLILSLNLPEQLKVTTFLGFSIISSPVAGFRPFHAFFSFTQNLPNPLANTLSSSASREDLMISSRVPVISTD